MNPSVPITGYNVIIGKHSVQTGDRIFSVKRCCFDDEDRGAKRSGRPTMGQVSLLFDNVSSCCEGFAFTTTVI